MTVSFTVIGTPAPQGSKTKWGTEENPNTRPWRAAVAAEAALHRDQITGDDLAYGPVELKVHFFFSRPKSHYRTGKHAGELKPSAPFFKASPPDLDKLQRAVGDALKGVILHDDAQIVEWHATKLYGTPERAEITVEAA